MLLSFLNFFHLLVMTLHTLKDHSFLLGLRQALQDFVAKPEEGEIDGDADEGPNPNELLEVQNNLDFLPELSAEEVDSFLSEFDLTEYPFSDSPTASSPSLQPNSTTYDKFANISKNLEGTESSNTTPLTYIDIVQQALYDPSVFGPGAFDLTF